MGTPVAALASGPQPGTKPRPPAPGAQGQPRDHQKSPVTGSFRAFSPERSPGLTGGHRPFLSAPRGPRQHTDLPSVSVGSCPESHTAFGGQLLLLILISQVHLCCNMLLHVTWDFSRQEYWSGLPFLSPGDLSDPGIKRASPTLQVDSFPLSHHRSPYSNMSQHLISLYG